jgi:hypothetical protein
MTPYFNRLRTAGPLLAAISAWWLGLPAHAAEVGVSISISQPGVYGRVDIGQFPQPAVVVSRPVIIRQAPVAVAVEPVYLWVPPGHRKHWGRHCGEYRACNVPVYFVRDDWYRHHVAEPHRRDHDDHDRGYEQEERRGDDHHGHGHDDHEH